MAGGKKDLCGICSSPFNKNQQAVQCDVCQTWFHSSCENIGDEEFKVMASFKNVSFICSICKSKPLGSSSKEFMMLNAKFDSFLDKSKEDSASLKQILNEMTNLKSDFTSSIKSIKTDVEKCDKRIDCLESSLLTKIAHLEVINNSLYRKLNRADILIRGLPEGLSDLPKLIIELGSFYSVPLSRSDVNHVCYFHNKQFVLVKFNNVHIRDTLMKSYFQTIKQKALKVSSVLKTDVLIDKRVYLNDYYSPSGAKLNAVCKKMLSDKIISKFRILDLDVPKARVCMPDGKDLVLDAAGCIALLGNSTADKLPL